MSKDNLRLRSEKVIIVNTDTQTLWAILTESRFTKEYMFNCEVKSAWETGSTIIWAGNFEGYEAYQKGNVLAIEPLTLLKYSTFDPNFGLEDKPENYIHVSYLLRAIDNSTELTIINETFDGNKERMNHITQGWEMVTDKLKEVAERKQ